MHGFVEDVGQLFAGWGLARNTGRIWGYLLLRNEPAGLDRIAGDLGIAKSGVSVGARQLVQLGLARGIGERGSRRLLYEALPELEAIFAARNASVIALHQTLRRGALAAADGVGRERLTDMAEMTQELMDLIPNLLQQLRQNRESRARRRA
ncbi:MAG TPA: ArsR family transcriptional regulator [Candidatus Dormibacteraeota bacterium]|nr:ArsR family transcriptional regulator [Candidatus Dormibacteraeota bacterium]